MSKSTFFEGRFSTLLTIFLEHIWVRNPKNNRIGKCQIQGKTRVFSYVCIYKVKMSKSTFFEGYFSTLLTIFLEHIWVRNPKNNRIGKCQIQGKTRVFSYVWIYRVKMSKSTFFEGCFSTLLTIFLEHIWVRNSKKNRIGKCQISGKTRVFSYVCIYKVKNVKVHFFRRSFFDTFNHISGTYMGQEH